MKVFAPMFGLDPDSNLGGEVYDASILTGLARKGHRIDVLLRKGQKAPQQRNLNIHYFPLGTNALFYSTIFFPMIFFMSSLRRLISEADVIRVHSPFFLGFWSIIGRLFFRSYPKVLLHYHHIDDKSEMKVFDRFLPRHANYLSFLCKETRTDLQKRSDIRKTQFAILPPGIDTETFRSVKTDLKQRLNIGKSEKIILFVGALIPRKGIDVLMKSWDIVKQRHNVHLIIIGQGPLDKLIKKEKRVHHISYLDNKSELVEYYNVADVLAFPTRLEGFGMVAGEAMACSTPVVSTNASGIKDIIDDKTGFKVDIGDVEMFTEKIELLLTNEKLRKDMGKNSIKRIRKMFTWNETINRTEKFLEMIKNA